MSSTRGWKNRNPGNLKYSPNVKWQGMDSPPSDGQFIRFKSLAWGLRAMIVLARTYKHKYGVDTLGEYMSKYAPVGPENPKAYHDWVATKSGLSLKDVVDLEDRKTLERIFKAQIAFENGNSMEEVDERLPQEVWTSAWSLANPLTKSTTIRASAGAAATIAAGVVEVATNHVDQLATAGVTASTLWPKAAPLIMGGVAICFVAVIVWSRFSTRAEGIK